jgi:hypothetical protein
VPGTQVRLSGGQQALRGPVLDRAFCRRVPALERGKHWQLFDRVVLILADPLDHAGIAEAVHVHSAIEGSNLGVVSAAIVVIANVHRHMHVLDAVDEESQGEPPVLSRLGRVFQDGPELVDLVDNATVLRVNCRPLGVIARFVERDVHVVPGSGLGQPPSVLIGPRRGVGAALTFIEQSRDRGLNFRVQVLLGDPGNDPVTESAPSKGGGCGLKGNQQTEGESEL